MSEASSRQRRYRNMYWCLLLLLGCIPAHAKNALNFSSRVIEAPPCIINNGQTIDVNFGDQVQVNRIDGINYRKTIDYTLDCKEAGNNALRMQIQGHAASFGNGVLAQMGSSYILGIAFKANGADFPINTWLKLEGSAKPTLIAVPVKQSGLGEVYPGRFSAGATLLFEFQ